MSQYERYHNFSAGPAALPLSVLEEAARDLVCYPNAGASVLELSHRGKVIDGIIKETEARLRRILNVPDNYHVLFMHGGATTQFCMIPANFLDKNSTAAYIEEGTWSKKAIAEAKRCGNVNIIWTDKENNFTRVPRDDEYEVPADAKYLHITSNETIHGVEFHRDPKSNGVPLVCDSSSDFLGRPIDITKYAMVYAGAQKNIGPAGVTVAIIKDEFLQTAIEDEHRAIMMNYKVHAENHSLYNTCPVFNIYVVGLVLKWLEEEKGGIANIYKENLAKAELLYKTIDESDGFYKGHANVDSRSIMNVTWNCPNEEIEKEFVKASEAAHMLGLKGHRSLGGIRASIYNATSLESVEALVKFMKEFKNKH